MLESLLCKKLAQAGELGEPSLLREQALVARLCNLNLLSFHMTSSLASQIWYLNCTAL